MSQPTHTDAVLGNAPATPSYPLLELANEKLKGSGFSVRLGINVDLQKHSNGQIYFNNSKPQAVFEMVETNNGKETIVASDSDWFHFMSQVEGQMGFRWMNQTGFQSLKHEDKR